MTRTPFLAAAIALTAALAGCGAPAAPGAPSYGQALGAAASARDAAEARGVDAAGTIRIDDPARSYVLQAITAWNQTDVTKVKLRLFKKTNGSYVATGLTTDVANAALGSAVKLSNLKLATDYKVVAEAYDASGARIDNQAQKGSDADCAVTFSTPALVASASGDNVDDAVINFVAPVKLMNKTFAGQASSGSGVAVTNGTITSTTATESF